MNREMKGSPQQRMTALTGAHAAQKAGDLARLRALSLDERGLLIESACEAAMEVLRSRDAAGLPRAAPAPWPASTWEFLKKHAACVST
jgi:hypothetical protein